MRILVTGGAGFIGSHITVYLSRKGFVVEALDNLERSSEINLERLRRERVNIIVSDLRREDLRDLIKRFDVVIHAAAYVSVEESISNPWSYLDNNYYVTERISRLLKKDQKMIYISSAAVYGEPVNIPIRENDPKKPKSPYGLSKLLGEKAVVRNALCRGYRYVVLRLFNVYGEGQNPLYAGVITNFIARVSRDLPPVIYGDGSSVRDFIHVLDVVDAVYRAVVRDVSGIYNIGTGRGVSVKELAELVIRISDKKDLEPIYSSARPGDIKISIADISRAREELGFEPRTSLVEGITDLIKNRFYQNSRP